MSLSGERRRLACAPEACAAELVMCAPLGPSALLRRVPGPQGRSLAHIAEGLSSERRFATVGAEVARRVADGVCDPAHAARYGVVVSELAEPSDVVAEATEEDWAVSAAWPGGPPAACPGAPPAACPGGTTFALTAPVSPPRSSP